MFSLDVFQVLTPIEDYGRATRFYFNGSFLLELPGRSQEFDCRRRGLG